jgi:hypothetical protein
LENAKNNTTIAGVNMTPLHLIIFLFIGHSNMQGYCAMPDTVTDPHVWAYDLRHGFFNCSDKDMIAKSGSPLMPFLKRMARTYPGYNFCGIQHASPCQQAFHLLSESRHKECLINQINMLKGKGTFGGALFMYGVVENLFNTVDSLQPEFIKLVAFLREQTGDKKLPIILGRFEENGDHVKGDFYRHQAQTIKIINHMPRLIENCSLTPFKPVPKEEFCDDHHYNQAGYKRWTWDAVTIYKYNGYDSWARK